MLRADKQYDATMQDAYARGEEDGEAAASWYFDGNTTLETYERVLEGIENGDPEILDTIPGCPLSGEWADGTTPADVLSALGVPEEDDAEDDYLRAYEDGYESAALGAIEDAARTAVATTPRRVYFARARDWYTGEVQVFMVEDKDDLSPDTLHPIQELDVAEEDAESEFCALVEDAGRGSFEDIGPIDYIYLHIGHVCRSWQRDEDEGRGA